MGLNADLAPATQQKALLHLPTRPHVSFREVGH